MEVHDIFYIKLASEYLKQAKPTHICACDGALDSGCLNCSADWLAKKLDNLVKRLEEDRDE